MLNYLDFTWLVLIGRIPSICWITCMLQNTKQNTILVMHDYMSQSGNNGIIYLYNSSSNVWNREFFLISTLYY